MSLWFSLSLLHFACLAAWVHGSYVVHHFNGTQLRCAPSTCTDPEYDHLVVHNVYIQIKVHNVHVVVYRYVHFGGAQCIFLLVRWCTWRFVMFVTSYHLDDGAQCDVVSLDDFFFRGQICGHFWNFLVYRVIWDCSILVLCILRAIMSRM